MKRTIVVIALTAAVVAIAPPASSAPPGRSELSEGPALGAGTAEPTLAAWESAGIRTEENAVVRTDGPVPAVVPSSEPPLPEPVNVYSEQVERWRPLVGSHFEADDIPWAMRVMNCESKGDPRARNPRTAASGLFQHLLKYWADRSAKAGWGGSDVFDPVANVAVAAWLYYNGGPSHWTCR